MGAFGTLVADVCFRYHPREPPRPPHCGNAVAAPATTVSPLVAHHLAGRRCVVPRCVRARPGGCLALRAPRLGFPLPTKGTPRAVFTRGLVAFLCCNFEASSRIHAKLQRNDLQLPVSAWGSPLGARHWARVVGAGQWVAAGGAAMSNTGKFADRTPGIPASGLTSALANESSAVR